MRQKPILIFLIIQLCLVSGLLFPENVEVSARVSAEKIGMDDVLVYTLSFKGIANPNQPDLSSLQHFQVAQTSRSMRQEFVNGVYSQSMDYIFYLRPTNTGIFNIPPFTYEYQGKEYKTSSFSIQVVKGSVTPRNSRRRNSLFDRDDDFFAPFNRRPRATEEVDVKMKIRVSRKDVVQGEQIQLRILLYARNAITSINMLSNPTIPGFWQEWYPIPKTIDGTEENVDGKNYNVFEIRRVALFPNNTGIVTIPSLKFEVAFRDNSYSIFSENKRVTRSTPEVKINVRKVPGQALGQPVGEFSLNVRPMQDEIDINDILTLKVSISGKGNLKVVEPPVFDNCDYFKVYKSKITRNNDYNEKFLSGTVVAEVPVAFKKSGLISFPELSFTYYSPSQGKVITKTSRPFAVKVTGTKEKQENASTVSRTEVVKTGEDIDFIKNGSVYNQGRYLHQTGIFTFLTVVFFLANLLFFLKIFVFDRFISQSSLVKNKKILTNTIKKVKEVKDYGEIFLVIEYYLKEKAGLGLAVINNYSIEEFFEKHGVGNSDIRDFIRIKSESESARFSPVKKTEKELKKDIKLLVEIFKRVDGKIK